jgi:hypothetical protein
VARSLLTRTRPEPTLSDCPSWHAPLQNALRRLSMQADLAADALDYGPLTDWRLYQFQAAFHQVMLALEALEEKASVDSSP